MNKLLQIRLIITFILLTVLLLNCSNHKPDETLWTKPGQAWVYEKGSQKIAFFLNASGYRNYIFDNEMDVFGSVDIGFHTNMNIIYFHFEMYDAQGNYLGVGGDSLSIAKDPNTLVNLYEFAISGNQLTLTKPEYSYISPEQGMEYGDVSYNFTKKSFTPPKNISMPNLSNNTNDNAINNIRVHSYAQLPVSIIYVIGDDEHDVSIYIYNISGQRIKTLTETVDGYITWNGTDYDGNNVPAGLYFFITKTENGVNMRDLVFLM